MSGFSSYDILLLSTNYRFQSLSVVYKSMDCRVTPMENWLFSTSLSTFSTRMWIWDRDSYRLSMTLVISALIMPCSLARSSLVVIWSKKNYLLNAAIISSLILSAMSSATESNNSQVDWSVLGLTMICTLSIITFTALEPRLFHGTINFRNPI